MAGSLTSARAGPRGTVSNPARAQASVAGRLRTEIMDICQNPCMEETGPASAPAGRGPAGQTAHDAPSLGHRQVGPKTLSTGDERRGHERKRHCEGLQAWA